MSSAIITGSAKRIGREIAITLAKNNYNIAIHYNNSVEEAEQVKAEIVSLGVQAEIFQADLFKQNQYKKLIDNVFNIFPDTEILINNASIFEKDNFDELKEDFFDKNMQIHVKAPLFLSHYFAQKLKNSESKNYNIINFIDTKIKNTSSVYFSYLISKKALFGATEQMARSLAGKIRVNMISPGLTELMDDDNSYTKNRIEDLPVKEKVKLEYITDAIMHIINNHGLIGQNIILDSGESLL